MSYKEGYRSTVVEDERIIVYRSRRLLKTMTLLAAEYIHLSQDKLGSKKVNLVQQSTLSHWTWSWEIHSKHCDEDWKGLHPLLTESAP